MRYRRMPIEIESPEQLGYDAIGNNLSESSISDRRLADLGIDLGSNGRLPLDELLLCYGDHMGDLLLREAIAEQGDELSVDDVIVTPGAAAALFATATSLLEPGDHAVVVRTNYATNLETPRAIGAELDIVDLVYEDAWQLDPMRVRSLVRPGVSRNPASAETPTNPRTDFAAITSTRGNAQFVSPSGLLCSRCNCTNCRPETGCP